jgi:modulator of FtsH protease HflC
MRWFFLTLGVVLLAVLVRMCVFTVDPGEFVYVTQFGAHVATYDGGARESDAGLYFRLPWPIQSVQRLDRRLQQFDLPAIELLTREVQGKGVDKTLLVEAFVCWRIRGKDDNDLDAVDRFVRRLGTAERARDVLYRRVSSALSGQRRMDEFISTEADAGGKRKVEASLEALRDELVAGLREEAQKEYGIELVDVRLRRFSPPEQARNDIFNRIRAERGVKVEQYRSEGQTRAKNIRSDAEEQARKLLAEARAQEKILKGEAEAEADVIRSKAHAQDPEFYAFLKKLDQMQSILGDNKSLLLLSTHRPMFEMLFQPPRPGAMPQPGKGEEKSDKGVAGGKS